MERLGSSMVTVTTRETLRTLLGSVLPILRRPAPLCMVGVVLSLAACRGESRDPAGAARDPGRAAADSSVGLQTIRVGELTMEVPAAWQRAPEQQVKRLLSAGVRRDPGAGVQIVAMTTTEGAGAPAATLMIIRQTPTYSAGSSVQDAVDNMRSALEQGAGARGAELTIESNCEERFCDFHWTMAGGQARSSTKSRCWRSGGRLATASCGCANDGCSYLSSCSLPGPPANAALVTER